MKSSVVYKVFTETPLVVTLPLAKVAFTVYALPISASLPAGNSTDIVFAPLPVAVAIDVPFSKSSNLVTFAEAVTFTLVVVSKIAVRTSSGKLNCASI